MSLAGASPARWRTEHYDFFGAKVDVSSDLDAVLDRFAETFAHFRGAPGGTPAERTLRVAEDGGELVLEDEPGPVSVLGGQDSVLPALLDRVNQILFRRLAAIGIVAIHASAVVHGGGALVIAGPSGRGKSTLALGLVSGGMQLLSDELALVDRDARTILPYRRSVHVRPGTPELVPQVEFLLAQPQRLLGGGIRWALAPERLAETLPGCLADPAPLSEVLLLEPRTPGGPAITPVDRGSAVVELMRGTPMVVETFMPPLRRLSQAVSTARCARLRPGGLGQTVELIGAWIAAGERER